jgi:hypothetical protein
MSARGQTSGPRSAIHELLMSTIVAEFVKSVEQVIQTDREFVESVEEVEHVDEAERVEVESYSVVVSADALPIILQPLPAPIPAPIESSWESVIDDENRAEPIPSIPLIPPVPPLIHINDISIAVRNRALNL